jgi:hypothetical protein
VIRYYISEQELIKRISQEKRSWLTRAKKRTALYRSGGYDPKATDFWGEIKRVYIDLQHGKCGYCETRLQDHVLASKVHEIEHFRPKGRIRAWPHSGAANARKFLPSWPTGEASDKGYLFLVYHPLNYAIACTRCNSTLKSDCFPILGKRMLRAEHPKRMLRETPLLFYPISCIDPDDPADLISFNGPFAVATYRTGLAYQRAITNIHFFLLNHQDLILQRCMMLLTLWIALSATPATEDGLEDQQMCIDICCQPYGEFSACANAFQALFLENHDKAKRYIKLIRKLINHKLPRLKQSSAIATR